MHLFVQMFERDFRFFHRVSLGLRTRLVQSLTFILSPDRDPKEEAAFVPGSSVYSKTDRQAVQKRFNSAAKSR